MWNYNPFLYRGLALNVGVAILLVFGGCAGREPLSEIANPVFFPPPPESPRLQFLASFGGAADLGAPGPSGFERFVLGEAEQQERIVTPYGVAIFDGVIYVCDVGQRRVVALDLKNRSFGYLTEDRRLTNPVNIRIQEDGTKYVADPTAGAVFVFDRSNALQAILGKELKISPIDVAIRGTHCYVTDFASNQVIVLDKETGQEVQRIGEAGDGAQQFTLISDLMFGPEGTLYVTDKLKAKIFEFDQSGNLRRTLGRLGDNIDELVRPKGVAIDDRGRIWVVDASTEVAKIYDQAGQLLLFFGLPGNEPGMMNLPAKIVLDYDNVDLFQRYAARGATIRFLVLVTNQYGPHKVSVYGFGDFPVGGSGEPEPPSASAALEMPRASAPPVPGPPARDARTARLSEAQQDEGMQQIVLIYYESMAFYRAGRLQEARAGFVEVIESGMIPPAMRQTLEGYLRDIDSRPNGEQGVGP